VNAHEKYLFDLQGFITVPNALSTAQLALLNATLNGRVANDMPADKPTMRWVETLKWGPEFRELLDNARVLPYLHALVGPHPRLDHEYVDVIRPPKTGAAKGPIGTTLHGGGSPFDPSQYYRFDNGAMHNGLIVVAYNLRDVNEGDGGFGCVPGSHKSNLPFPDEWRELDDFKPFMRAVTGPAGTAVIFTEALTHGTLPWRGAAERRTLFFKYSPHPLSWAAHYYDAANCPDLTDAQRAMLEPPNARYKGRAFKML
jgi:ectoine hydroxylase-related dioxygenase (phytanoyl-CoA dioxygenase family)